MSVHTFARPLEAFSRSADVYDLHHSRRDRDAEIALIAKMLGDPSSHPDSRRRVIDWGAGTGEHVRRWPQYGWESTGFDTSIPMVSAAQSKNIDVRPGDILEQPVEAGLFPAVAQTCLFASFSYATADPVGLPAALDTVRRWAAPDGLFIFDVVNYACCAAHLIPLARREFAGGVGHIHKRFNVRDGLLECAVRYELGKRTGGDFEVFEERHVMRAFTPREIEWALPRHGFDLLKLFDTESLGAGGDGEVRKDSYYFMVIARAR